MVWTIIFILSGGIQGALLAEAEILASETWLFWAIVLNNALSQFAIGRIVSNAWKKSFAKKETDHGSA